MAGSKTDAFEARLIDHIFKGGATPALTALSTVYVALYTAVPSDSSAGTEVVGSAYARQALAAAVWTHTAGSNTVSNTNEVAFPAVTGSPYTVVGWAIMDAASSGNQLYWGDCPSTIMAVGDIPRFAPGALTITED
jgi:hypothetical protein